MLRKSQASVVGHPVIMLMLFICFWLCLAVYHRLLVTWDWKVRCLCSMLHTEMMMRPPTCRYVDIVDIVDTVDISRG